MNREDTETVPAPRAHAVRGVGALTGAARELGAVIREIGRIPMERRAARPMPPPTGLVVDLGAGHDPFPRADLVVDKYVADDFERGYGLTRGRPLVVADGEALPFADNAIAYLIAAHVVEHAVDPQSFAAEISRVARAGFVQVPTATAERVFGWAFHPWLIEQENGRLVFAPNESERWEGLHELYNASPLLRVAFFAHRSKFHHTVHWADRLQVSVTGKSRADETSEFDLERTLAALHQAPPPPLPTSICALLRCPVCQGELKGDKRGLGCVACGRRYPLAGGAAVLLKEAAVF